MALNRNGSPEGSISKKIVTTKGDLITATANAIPSRLAAGSDGDTLVADSSTSTGLRWQGSIEAGKNFLINGNFDFFQRGTSISFTNNGGYTTDRFYTYATGTMTVSRQSSGVPAGSQYCVRMTSNATSSVADFFQFIETANVVPLQGKTVTYSIKMRRNATNTTDGIVLIQKSATVDAGTGASWTTVSSVTVLNASIPTGTGVGDWYTATVTTTIPNDGTANSLRVYASTAALMANNGYLELAQAQLEIGSVATTFSRAGGTIQGELAACQRYYFRATASNVYTSFGAGANYSTSASQVHINHPVSMRIGPASVDYSTLALIDATGTVKTFTTLTLSNTGPLTSMLGITGSSGLVAGYSNLLIANNSTSAYLGFSAEL